MGGRMSKVREHINNNKGFYGGITALTLAGLADAGLTMWNISQYDTEIEGNPIMRNYINHFGTYAGLMGFKASMALGGVCAAMASRVKRKWPDWVEKRMRDPEKIKRRLGDFALYIGATGWAAGATQNLIGIINPDLAESIERYVRHIF